MKKLIAFLLCLVMVLSLVACAPADNADDTKPADTKPADTKPADTKPADPVPTGDSALIFAVVAVISLCGVAVVAKRREN